MRMDPSFGVGGVLVMETRAVQVKEDSSLTPVLCQIGTLPGAGHLPSPSMYRWGR